MSGTSFSTTELTQRVRAAAADLQGLTRRTPLVTVPLVGVPVQLKLENLQHTGSFKYRGALATLRAAQRSGAVSGCVTYSAGNHGCAVARAAAAAGVSATVFMPSFAEPSKVRLVEQEGATAVLVDGSELATRAHDLADKTGALFIHPFDQASVMAGRAPSASRFLNSYRAKRIAHSTCY